MKTVCPALNINKVGRAGDKGEKRGHRFVEGCCVRCNFLAPDALRAIAGITNKTDDRKEWEKLLEDEIDVSVLRAMHYRQLGISFVKYFLQQYELAYIFVCFMQMPKENAFKEEDAETGRGAPCLENFFFRQCATQ